jgi:type VI secretion system protein ImpM
MNDDPDSIAGWFGKIPALGDFASRRLPPGFVSAWDAWLQQSMAASRESLGEAWLELYLTSPIWRFLLGPGVCGENAWLGMLMPSVDQVGRHFPLTIVKALPADADVFPCALGASEWMAAVENAALRTLDIDASVSSFEEGLAALPFPGSLCGTPDEQAVAREIASWCSHPDPAPLELQCTNACARLWTAAALAHFSKAAHGRSFWWHEADGLCDARLIACSALPSAPDFERLLRDAAALAPG